MSKRHNRTGRSRYDARHVRLYHWLYNSPAWKSLTPQQRAVYLELECRHNGSNNGDIRLSVREAAEACHIGKDTAARCLELLQERGFIRCAQKGAFSWKKRHASLWALTAWPTDDATATKDFMRWRPKKKITVPG